MPPTSIFPERRSTRSQVTLPDTVLAIPEKSPLKIAKSRNTTAMRDTVVEDSEGEGEDELVVMKPRLPEAIKRSASPAVGNEYEDGRDLKRRKRDIAEEGPSIEEVEPRRSTRHRFTPSNRKPESIVSASPPPTTRNSPAPAPTKDRAQSVPLFASAEDLDTDMPRIDFTKLQRSPKRKRSRSRSPVKDVHSSKGGLFSKDLHSSSSSENTLRLHMATFKMPTIHAGVATGSLLGVGSDSRSGLGTGTGAGLGSRSGGLSDGETSVAEEREMEIPTAGAVEGPPQSSSPLTTPADESADTFDSPLVPAPGPEPEPQAEPVAADSTTTLTNLDTNTTTTGPTAPSAPLSVPATPAANTNTMSLSSLDKVMPMSPLTPVPPTPFPPARKRGAAYTKSRLGMQMQVDVEEDEEEEEEGEGDEDGDMNGTVRPMQNLTSGGVASSTLSEVHATTTTATTTTTTTATATTTTTATTAASSSRSASLKKSVPSQTNGRASGSGSGSSQPPSLHTNGHNARATPKPSNKANNTNNTNTTTTTSTLNKTTTTTTTTNIKKPTTAAALPSSSSLPALASNSNSKTNTNSNSKLKPQAKPKPKGNVYEMLLASSKGKGKAVALPSSPSFPSLSPFPTSFSSPTLAGSSSPASGPKLKMKDRMRKREKEQVERPVVIAALPEEEEEQAEVDVQERQVEVEEEKQEVEVEKVDEEKADTEVVEDRAVEEERSTTAVPDAEQDQPKDEDPSPAIEAPAEPVPDVDEEIQDIVMEEPLQEPSELQETEPAPEALSQEQDRDEEVVVDGSEMVEGGEMEMEEKVAAAPGPSVIEQSETGMEIVEEDTSAATTIQPSEPAQVDMEKSSEDATAIPTEATVEDEPPAVEASGDPEAGDEEAAKDDEQDPEAPPAKQSKTALGKRRQPAATAIPMPTRITRSTSTKKYGVEVAQPAPAGPSRTKPARPNFKAPLKRTASGKVKAPEASTSTSSTTTGSTQDTTDKERPKRPRTPGSPMKISSPKKAAPKLTKDGDTQPTHVDLDAEIEQLGGGTMSLTATPVTKRRRGSGSPSPKRPASSPSPTKAGRSYTDYTPIRPAANMTRTFSSGQIFSRPGSSLSQLSSALEKLKQPGPARPSTSLGFNPNDTDNDTETLRTKDDGAIGQRKSFGLTRQGSSVSQRSATFGSESFKTVASTSSTMTTATGTTTTAGASSSSSSLTRPTASSQAKFVQKKLLFGPNKAATGPAPRFGTNAALRGGRAVGAGPVKARALFGPGGALKRTASKKSSLPVVMGSPVKGGASSSAAGEGAAEEEEEEEEGGEIFNAIVNNGGSATTLLTNLLAQQPDKGKGKDTSSTRPPAHSRRVSMLSRDLMGASASLPPEAGASNQAGAAGGPSGSGSGGKGLMGPPPTPPSVASVKSTSDSGSPTTGAVKRSSARIAKTAAAAEASAVAAGKKRAMDPPPVPNPAAEVLQVLNDCTIFVDVKTDDGDEAGMLFVDMLGKLGARIAAGVGLRCTHIVFKNGMSSTTNKYKAMRDPKPHVVSIGWVVACAEQRTHVPEAEYLVNLDFANLLGGNKRRRASVAHRLFADPVPDYSESAERNQEPTDDGDRSMDGSVSSITMEDDGLAPLERARRRKSMMVGHNP